MRRFCLALALAVFLAACGQKGALYLPEDGDKEQKSAPRKTEEGTLEK